MADNITQTFALDASNALANLSKLDTAFSSLNAQLRTNAAAAKEFNSAAKGISAFGNQSAAAAQKVGKAFKQNMGGAQQSVTQLTVSWGLLSRIVTTQLIVSELRRLKETMADAVTDGIAFQTSIAEIQTIADGSLGTFRQVANSVRDISDAFNLPLGDAAKGLYETISSQIGEGAENVEFLASASAFAKGSVTSLENSVNLLAGTLNAFQKDASEVDDVASKLFRTIDLGNVNAEQLTTSFNRTSGRAQQLGVSFEEQAAAFAVLTNRGIKHNEVATQLSGILSALVKPTEKMTEALRALGFSSAESAIKTLGLGGLLKELQATTGGSAESLAELFPNVRALSGALSLGSQASDQYAGTLETSRKTSANLAKEKAIEILATDAQKVQSEMNKLSNLLTVDFGQSLLKAGANAAQLTGGVDNLGKIMDAFGPVLVTGTGLLSAYALAALAGVTANAKFAASFSLISKGALLIAEAFAGGQLIGDKLLDAIEAPRKAFEQQQKAALSQLKASNVELNKEQADAVSGRVRILLEGVREENKAYLASVQNAEKAGKAIVKTAEKITSEIEKTHSDFVDTIKSSWDEAGNIAEQSQARVAGLQARQSDRGFEDSTRGLSDAGKVFALTSRSSDLANEAARALNTAAKTGNDADLSRALSTFDRAQAAGEEARAIAERSGNRGLEVRAARQLDEVTQKQVAAEQQLQGIQDGRKGTLDQLQKAQTKALDSVRDQLQIVRDNSSVLDQNGALLPPAEIEKRRKAMSDALKQIGQSGIKDLKLFDEAGLGEQVREFNNKLALQSLDLQFNTEGAVARLQADLASRFQSFKLNLNFDISGIEQELGRVLGSPDEITGGISEIEGKLTSLRNSFSQLGESEKETKRLKQELLAIAASSDEAGRTIIRAFGTPTSLEKGREQVAALRKELEFLTKSGQITDKQLAGFEQRVGELGKTSKTNLGLGADFSEFSQSIELLKQLQSFQQQQAANPANTIDAVPQMERLQQLLEGAQTKAQQLQTLPQSFTNAVGPAQQLSTAINTMQPTASALQQVGPSMTVASTAAAAIGTGLQTATAPAQQLQALPQSFQTSVGAIQSMAVAMQQVAAAAKEAAAASQQISSGGGETAQFGRRFFATGGRGIDTIPAWLSEGEMVINAKSTGKFFSQLSAMNAGQIPAFHNGGNVTNNNSIGDIVVNGASSPEETGRVVLKKIRRELRRGTGRL